MRKVSISTSCLTRLLSTPATNAGDENELLRSPMNRWSYSTPNDQFGAKPYSNPTPTAAPQRVALAAASSTPVMLLRTLKRLLVTAAPPFTYSSAAFQA